MPSHAFWWLVLSKHDISLTELGSKVLAPRHFHIRITCSTCSNKGSFLLLVILSVINFTALQAALRFGSFLSGCGL